MRQHADHEDQDGDDRQGGDPHHDLQCLTGPPKMNADEDGIEDGVDQRAIEADQFVDVAADEDRDGRRRNGVLEQYRRAGDIPSQGPKARRAKL